jgi:hypothetical protein
MRANTASSIVRPRREIQRTVRSGLRPSPNIQPSSRATSFSRSQMRHQKWSKRAVVVGTGEPGRNAVGVVLVRSPELGRKGSFLKRPVDLDNRRATGGMSRRKARRRERGQARLFGFHPTEDDRAVSRCLPRCDSPRPVGRKDIPSHRRGDHYRPILVRADAGILLHFGLGRGPTVRVRIGAEKG